MKLTSAEQLAKIGIFIQFMALVRCLFEYFRLKSVYGGTLTMAAVEPFIAGSLIAALGAWIAVVCFFLRWYKTAGAVAGGTVVLLLGYKFYYMR
ncbi:MAG TPA: hypothetical protein VNH83_11600 [Bryobacteraceae bacterium]|nr:hypothetical protein [Bryobacteraceae bacterium]